MRKAISRSSVLVGVVMLALLTLGAGRSGARPAKLMGYTVTPLVSDQKGAAPNRDKNLVNSWGLSASSIVAVVVGQQRDEHVDALPG